MIASALRLDDNALILNPMARTIFSEISGKVPMRPIRPQPVETCRNITTIDTANEYRQKELARKKQQKNTWLSQQ